MFWETWLYATWRERIYVYANNGIEIPTWGYIQEAAAAFTYTQE